METHKARTSSHSYPAINARDKLLLEARKPRSVIAIGRRSNRQGNSLFKQIVTAVDREPSEIKARRYQSSNRCDKNNYTHNTDAQLAFLLDCFGAETKMNDK